MARKLSHIARCAAFFFIASVASLAERSVLAEGEIQSTVPSSVIDNPFATSEALALPKPRVVPDEPQTAHRPAVTYQNPFAAMSKSPPSDSSLRPGPVSRWRRPTIQHDEPSSVKSAVLSTHPVDPIRAPWDQLSPDAIRFPPKPLTQPSWLTAGTDPFISNGINTLPLDPAEIDAPLTAGATAQQTVSLSTGTGADDSGQVTSAFAFDLAKVPPAMPVVSPTVVSDCADTPGSWFEQAQHAASNADSPEDLSAVIQLCDRGMRGTPDDKLSTSLRRLSAWAHNRRGEFQADAGSADDALNDFQTAISLDANCSLAIHNRAVTLAQQNQFAAALRDFNRVIELNPGLAVAYRNRAELLAALGRMDEAVVDYSQAIESLPNNAQLYRGRAYAQQRLGHFREASVDLNHALDISPDDAETLTQRGDLAAEKGEYEQAVKSFQRALTVDPNWAEAHRSLAWLQATCPDPQFHNPQQAIAAAEKAAELSPGNEYLILDTLAAARASAGQFEQAIEVQEKALASAPPELAPSLKQRLAFYQHGRAYRSEPTSTAVRPASHESPADSPSSRKQAR